MGKYDEEIKRKALSGIALTNPTTESQNLYDSYKNSGTSTTAKTNSYANTTQGNTGQVQYSPLGTFTASPTASNIQLTDSMLDEIKNKASTGTPLSNWSAQKQELYNGYNNVAPTYNTYTSENAPTYTNQYEGLIQNALDELLGKTGNFSYDYSSDPLYDQYKESYRREGDRALTNSMAEATALTGGRVNSNSIVAGQQAQNYYNAQLNDKIPELEQYAYQKHLSDLAQYQSNIGTMQGLEGQDYGKYQDQLSQYNTDRNFDYGALMDENNYNYNNYRDTQNYDRSVIENDRSYDYNMWNAQNGLAQDQRNFNYQSERDLVGDSQWERNFVNGQNEFAQNMSYNKERAASSDSQWSQSFNRGNYEYDTSRSDNLSQSATNRADTLNQQSIENALNEYKAKNSSSSSSNSGYSFKDYASEIEDMINATNPNTKAKVYDDDTIKDKISEWYSVGAISNEEARQLFNMHGYK